MASGTHLDYLLAGPITVQVIVQLNGNNIGPIGGDQNMIVSNALRQVLDNQFGES